MPELETAISAMDTTIARVRKGETICCPKELGSCLRTALEANEKYRECGTFEEINDDILAAKEEKSTLQAALDSWNKSIQDGVDAAKNKAKAEDIDIANWFNGELTDIRAANDAIFKTFNNVLETLGISSVDEV